MRAFAFSLLAVLLTALRLCAGVDEDWNYILALDAGPKKKPATREEAALAARNHLHIQRKAIERFLMNHPGDARVFDAKLRLARVVAAEGKISNDQVKVDEALELFADLEKSAGVPREKLADAGFSRASLLMQSQQGSPERTRESIVRSAQNFTAKYPGDRRGPRLLVEAATVCDDVPNQKRDLLEEALRLTDEEPLKRRITDDLRRVDLLGKSLRIEDVLVGWRPDRPGRASRERRRVDLLVERLSTQPALAARFSFIMGDASQGSSPGGHG